MEDENKQDQSPNPHVRFFGGEVGRGSGAESSQPREDWKAQRQARKEEWKARRREMHEQYGHHRHGGGFFWGLVLLFVGIVALLHTMGLIPTAFWHAILPFWPILIILWGAGLILGRHWFARIIIFILALVLFIGVAIYGVVKIGSPISTYLPPDVVSQINNSNP